MTPEQCQRISQAKQGSKSWNKGNRSSPIHSKWCACGKEFFKNPDSGNDAWHRQVSCSKGCALKGNKRTLGMFLGELNPSWKGGVTAKNALIRSSTAMNEWRKKVFERDDYTCQDCGERGGKLHTHHVKAFSQYPELRFDVTNGQTLCYECHKKTDNYAGKLARIH